MVRKFSGTRIAVLAGVSLTILSLMFHLYTIGQFQPQKLWLEFSQHSSTHYRTSKTGFLNLTLRNTGWKRIIDKLFHLRSVYLDKRVSPPIIRLIVLMPMKVQIRIEARVLASELINPHSHPTPQVLCDHIFVPYGEPERLRGVLVSCGDSSAFENSTRLSLVADASSLRDSDFTSDPVTLNFTKILEPVSLTTKSYKLTLASCMGPFRRGSSRFHGANAVAMVELVRAAGVEHLVLPIDDLYPSTATVFRYYESIGVVSMLNFTLPVMPFLTYAHVSRMSFTDCIYRLIGVSQYTAVHDYDEYFIPSFNKSLMDILPILFKNPMVASVMVTRSHFCKKSEESHELVLQNNGTKLGVPLTLRFFGYIVDKYPKSLMRTELVIDVYHHGTYQVVPGAIGNELDSDGLAMCHHYRYETFLHRESKCVAAANKTSKRTLAYKDEVLYRYNLLLKELKLQHHSLI